MSKSLAPYTSAYRAREIAKGAIRIDLKLSPAGGAWLDLIRREGESRTAAIERVLREAGEKIE